MKENLLTKDQLDTLVSFGFTYEETKTPTKDLAKKWLCDTMGICINFISEMHEEGFNWVYTITLLYRRPEFANCKNRYIGEDFETTYDKALDNAIDKAIEIMLAVCKPKKTLTIDEMMAVLPEQIDGKRLTIEYNEDLLWTASYGNSEEGFLQGSCMALGGKKYNAVSYGKTPQEALIYLYEKYTLKEF